LKSTFGEEEMMNAPRDEVRTAMSELIHQLSTGWLYYLSAKHLYNSYEIDRVTCSRYFMLASLQATIDQSILILKSLVDSSAPSSFLKLRKAISESIEANSSLELLSDEEDRAILETISDRLSKLHSARLKPIFTLQQDPDDNAAVLATLSPNYLAQLDQCYLDALKLANRYQVYLEEEPLEITQLEVDVADDVYFVMDLMGGGCI
jgi:hypothetical protein